MRLRHVPPFPPGDLIAEHLYVLRRSRADLAHAIDVAESVLSDVIEGRRPVTADLALRLGRAFDLSPEYWLGLQNEFDLAEARDSLGRQLDGIARVVPSKRSLEEVLADFDKVLAAMPRSDRPSWDILREMRDSRY